MCNACKYFVTAYCNSGFPVQNQVLLPVPAPVLQLHLPLVEMVGNCGLVRWTVLKDASSVQCSMCTPKADMSRYFGLEDTNPMKNARDKPFLLYHKL